MIQFNLKGDWAKATKLTTGMVKRMPKAVDMATRAAAQAYRARVAQAFVKQGGGGKKWDPLGVITLSLRKNAAMVGKSAAGGTKALIRSGDMRKSVSLKKVAKAHYFVGVHRTHGKYNVARVHEQPLSKSGIWSIRVTDKMRRYFLYLFIKGAIPAPLKASTLYIIVRQRSFLQSVWDQRKDEIAKVAARRFQHVLDPSLLVVGERHLGHRLQLALLGGLARRQALDVLRRPLLLGPSPLVPPDALARGLGEALGLVASAVPNAPERHGAPLRRPWAGWACRRSGWLFRRAAPCRR